VWVYISQKFEVFVYVVLSTAYSIH
jgi:hypothetical protein